MPQGNGTQDHDSPAHPDPRQPPYPLRPVIPQAPDIDRRRAEIKTAAVQAGIKGQPMPAARPDMTHADQQPDFLNQVNSAAHLLSSIGVELGNVGHDDKAALQQFATAMQENTRRYVGQLIDRKRRELADLERILGKL